MLTSGPADTVSCANAGVAVTAQMEAAIAAAHENVRSEAALESSGGGPVSTCLLIAWVGSKCRDRDLQATYPRTACAKQARRGVKRPSLHTRMCRIQRFRSLHATN